MPVRRGEHRSDPLLCWPDAPPVGLQTKVPPQRGLDTVPVRNLTFDLRGLERFDGHAFDAEPQPLILGKVQRRPRDNPATAQNSASRPASRSGR